MSFSQHFFGKEIEQVTFQDVSDLISNRSDLESTYLECKSCVNLEVKSKNCVPTIVGFLNTDGGLLIVGTPREAGRSRQSQGVFTFHSDIKKDHLRDRLIGSVQPLPTGILIETIKKDGKDNQCVTIVDVPRSEYPPHQCQGTYYVRLDGSNKPAPHSLVEALFNGRRPRYQQALIEHFEKKLARFENQETVMKALYFLVIEHRPVEEQLIIAAVIGADKAGTAERNPVKESLKRLADLGILIFEIFKDDIKNRAVNYQGDKKYSVNPDYQELLAGFVLDRHQQKPFQLFDV